jgi:chaperonin GroEL (HSP60 family)
MYQEGGIEPVRIKKQSIASASEAAVMTLSIDDVVAASTLIKETPQIAS